MNVCNHQRLQEKIIKAIWVANLDIIDWLLIVRTGF